MGKRSPITNTDHLIAESNSYLKSLSLGISTNKGASSNIISVASTLTSTQLLASDSSRIQGIIHNDSTEKLYVKFGTSATTSDYTVMLDTDETLIVDSYTGVIHGVWGVVNGSAKVTDVTP